jgi:hypothetical protein
MLVSESVNEKQAEGGGRSREEIIFDLLVLLICLASFCCSWVESMVNVDNMHWGWAYLTALDVKRGAIPHAEVLIAYGYLYTLIQSIALCLFGERLISLGIITGIFYALSLFLSYRIFMRFMQRKLAFMAVLLMFLVHPYIIYPASNYMMYTFELLALIFFIKYPEKKYYGFLAGLSLGLSVLCRYSSFVAVVPPFIILLCWQYLYERKTVKTKAVAEKIFLMSMGFFLPLLIFMIYLALNSALGNFIRQNEVFVKFIGQGNDIKTYLNFLACIFQIEESLASDFRGKMFTVVLFICLWVMTKSFMAKLKSGVTSTRLFDENVFMVCIVAVFNYLNAVHIYETYRLANGASLGFGACIFVLGNCFKHSGKVMKSILVIIFLVVLWVLSSTLLFEKTTSAYYPWKKEILFGKGLENKKIKIFKGKLLSKACNDFYQGVYDVLKPFENKIYVLNYTWDSVAAAINDLPRVQISPYDAVGVDDLSKQEKLIEGRKAVILSYKKLDFPGYTTIFVKQWPGEIPWLGGGYLFVAVPEELSAKKPNIGPK